jgi:hypothetical protein
LRFGPSACLAAAGWNAMSVPITGPFEEGESHADPSVIESRPANPGERFAQNERAGKTPGGYENIGNHRPLASPDHLIDRDAERREADGKTRTSLSAGFLSMPSCGSAA